MTEAFKGWAECGCLGPFFLRGTSKFENGGPRRHLFIAWVWTEVIFCGGVLSCLG